jgi:outer membrane protein TolC
MSKAVSENTPLAIPEDQKLTHEEIARRAYALYEERGRTDGTDVDDWLQAERELTQDKTA